MEDSNPKYHPLSFVDIVIFLHQFLFPPGVVRRCGTGSLPPPHASLPGIGSHTASETRPFSWVGENHF